MAKGTVSGNYLMYQGKPLIRQDNAYVWGDMNERAVLILFVLSINFIGDGLRDASDPTQIG